jgi:hypothetical protein
MCVWWICREESCSVFSNELTQGSLVKVLGWAGLGPRWITYLWCTFWSLNSKESFVVQVATVSSSDPVSRQHVQQSLIKAIGWILLCSTSQTTPPPRLVPNLYHTKFPSFQPFVGYAHRGGERLCIGLGFGQNLFFGSTVTQFTMWEYDRWACFPHNWMHLAPWEVLYLIREVCSFKFEPMLDGYFILEY